MITPSNGAFLHFAYRCFLDVVHKFFMQYQTYLHAYVLPSDFSLALIVQAKNMKLVCKLALFLLLLMILCFIGCVNEL